MVNLTALYFYFAMPPYFLCLPFAGTIWSRTCRLGCFEELQMCGRFPQVQRLWRRQQPTGWWRHRKTTSSCRQSRWITATADTFFFKTYQVISGRISREVLLTFGVCWLCEWSENQILFVPRQHPFLRLALKRQHIWVSKGVAVQRSKIDGLEITDDQIEKMWPGENIKIIKHIPMVFNLIREPWNNTKHYFCLEIVKV